jgi:hypothetical protein
MLQQLFNSVFKSKQKTISKVLNDIDVLYEYICNNGKIYEETRFKQTFGNNYWLYLNYYPAITTAQQDKLITGCLNIILFLNQQYINDKGTIIEKYYSNINGVLNTFKPVTETHTKLYYMVREAMIISWKKINRMDYHGQQNIIYQSISWTLKNTILNNENPPEKIKNQR